MVTLVKHEWHSVDSQFTYELDEDTLSEIYPDLSEDEIAEKFRQIEEGEIDVEEIVNDAWENDVELEWDRQYDDWWTDRKGGYDVTYELGDESSYHHTPPPPEPTHKCNKCRWVGQSYETRTAYLREDGTVIEDYFNTEEESHTDKDICPMCDSDIELTEVGIKEEQERAERKSRWAQEAAEEEPVDEAELEAALEELKREFEELEAHTIKCTECEWSGTEKECEKEGICPNCAAHTEDIYRDDE
jgi:Zn finger protein HypA/HybF involved in hydrogenase expression